MMAGQGEIPHPRRQQRREWCALSCCLGEHGWTHSVTAQAPGCPVGKAGPSAADSNPYHACCVAQVSQFTSVTLSLFIYKVEVIIIPGSCLWVKDKGKPVYPRRCRDNCLEPSREDPEVVFLFLHLLFPSFTKWLFLKREISNLLFSKKKKKSSTCSLSF